MQVFWPLQQPEETIYHERASGSEIANPDQPINLFVVQSQELKMTDATCWLGNTGKCGKTEETCG